MKFPIKKVTLETVCDREDSAYVIRLDLELLRTPAQNPIWISNLPLAEAVQQEWLAQKTKIDFATMPMTCFLFALTDRIVPHHLYHIKNLADKIHTDSLLFPASHPDSLLKRQQQEWQPKISFVEEKLAISLVRNFGLIMTPQDLAVGAKIYHWIEQQYRANPAALLVAKQLTELSDSIILSMNFIEGQVQTVPELMASAYLHEVYQLDRWGEDGEARARLEALALEFSHLVIFWKFSQAIR